MNDHQVPSATIARLDRLLNGAQRTHATLDELVADVDQRISDYNECAADHNRLVRELDVLLNGEAGAAKQASLCDIVSQVKHMYIMPNTPTEELLDCIAGTKYKMLSPPKQAAERMAYAKLLELSRKDR